MAYAPLITLLLPSRISALAGGEAVDWLSAIALVGAASASFANIAFGWLSDRLGDRRALVWAGLALSCALLVAMPSATRLYEYLILVAIWQVALNMMLGPLAAWAGDAVPHAQKGALGGLLSVAPAAGALAGVVATWPGLAIGGGRFVVVALLVAACVLPLLLFGKPRAFPELMQSNPTPLGPDDTRPSRSVARMWLARFLVQISEAALFAFLLLWLASIAPDFGEARTARVMSAVLVFAIPVALLAGRWADRARRPILPLSIAAFASAMGLIAMALAPGLESAIAGYALFGVSAGVFLSLHSAQTLRVLPKPEKRGRDLGIFNLTNTTPSLVMPWLTLALVPELGFPALFALLAALATAAGLILLRLANAPKQ